MELAPFKRDIDDLIDAFADAESTTLADMKRIWLSKKFSYIFESHPPKQSASFMQSLYAHSIGYIIGAGAGTACSLSHRLGGLYCLFCLYETQPFKPPYKIYLSLEELKKLRKLVIDAKERGFMVVSALVRKMLDKNVFLFGFLDTNEAEKLKQVTQLEKARVQVAYDKLFDEKSKIGVADLIHMDMGMELEVKMVKKMSTDYAEAKKIAIAEAGKLVGVEDIKHIVEDKEVVGEGVEKMVGEWEAQREAFYQKTGIRPRQQLADDEEFTQELEKMLSET